MKFPFTDLCKNNVVADSSSAGLPIPPDLSYPCQLWHVQNRACETVQREVNCVQESCELEQGLDKVGSDTGCGVGHGEKCLGLPRRRCTLHTEANTPNYPNQFLAADTVFAHR